MKIALRQGPIELGLDTRLGGCCTYMRYQRADGAPPLDILRPLPPDCVDPFEAACFVMLPYSNRLFGGRLRMPDGQDLTLPNNCSRVSSPVHGVGWMAAWDIEMQAPGQVHLVYRHCANAHWPFAMECTQTIELTDDGVQWEASICNRGSEAMPVGLGFHPRFTLCPDALVTLAAATVWLQDDGGQLLGVVPVQHAPHFDYQTPQPAHALVLNHCYSQWSGVTTLDRPVDQLSVRVSASPNLSHLVVYRLPDMPWLCLEPISHATGALSLEAMDSNRDRVKLLSPGQKLTGLMNIRLSDYSFLAGH